MRRYGALPSLLGAVVCGTGAGVVRNDLYKRILARMNDHLDRVAFPVSRNR